MILRDARVIIGPYDLSADHSEVNLAITMPDLDNTRFGHAAESVAAGLAQIELTGSGFVRTGPGGTDQGLRGQLGLADVPVTIMSGDPETGDAAVELFKAQTFSYKSGAQVGQLYAFTYTAKGQGEMPARGSQIAEPAPITTNGIGTVYQFDLGAGARVLIALHVLSLSGAGASIAVVVRSDVNANFNTPVERATFPVAAAPGAWFVVVAGPVSDPYWRAEWAVTGTNPSINVVVSVGQE